MTASATADATTTEPPPLRRGVAAKLLGVNPRTLTRWVEAEIIEPVIMPNGERRYSKSSLAPWLPSSAAQVRTG
jgi:predicted site-specific integrase-resolvase